MRERDHSQNNQQNKFLIESKEEIEHISREQYLKMLEEGILEDSGVTNEGDE